MKEEKYVDILLKFNNKQITVEEFVDFMNSDEDFQKILNKSLKSYLAPSDTSIVDRINEEFAKIGTPNEKFTADTHTSTSLFDIHFLVKELIAKKYSKFLSQEDVRKAVLIAITEMPKLYDAEKEVEKYIKTNIINKMPKFEKLADAVKYAKARVNELFVCEKGNPSWAQSCEWPSNNKGEPMKFLSQKKIGEKVEYTFVDTLTNEKKIIVQYY